MNKERELLQRILDTQHTLPVHIGYEIEQLLAKPEQEHVLWIDPENYKQAIATPDGALRYLTRLPANGDIPLYTSPSKRDPLSDGDTADMYHANKMAIHPDSYWSGIKDAEKAHGIGENR
jgi:hypothetical protein